MSRGGGRLALVALVAVAVVFVVAGVAALAALPPLDNPYLEDQFFGGLSAVSVGSFVAWRRPGHPLGWLLLAAGTGMWASFSGSPVIAWMIMHTPSLEWVARALLALTIWGWIAARGIFLVFVPLCYPAPRAAGGVRRLQWGVGALVVGATCVAHARLYTFDYFAGVPATGSARLAERFEPWGHRAIFAIGIASITSMLIRVARLPRAEMRRHGPVAAICAVLLVPSLNSVYSQITGHGFFAHADQVELWSMIALPVVLAVGIVRHGLLDISVVVRRTAVYALCAIVLVAVYVTVVWFSAVVVTGAAGGWRVAATGAVAIAVLPVYVRVNRLVDRHLFGRRYDPAAVITALGATVERSPQGAQALELVTATVADELRLPFVALDLDVNGSKVRVAPVGTPCDSLELFALASSDGRLGDLVVARRTAREPFDARELSALRAIARQVAVVATNVLLTEQLKASRRSLVEAREEERRRIRRDLHDGLGPTLASVCLGLGAAVDQIGESSDLGALLRDLESDLRDAVDDIRRLVHDLRPPALDEFGLVRAVRDHADALTARAVGVGQRVHVSVDGPVADPEKLPAAVEVAAYRIAMEAITNVSRHSAALNCWVRIRADDDAVEVEVEDDGRGFDGTARAGVGLTSMRDRATELGGLIEVRERSPKGTLVRARLPLGGVLA